MNNMLAEPFTWQSKGRGFESPQLHKVDGSTEEDLPVRELLTILLGPDGKRRLMLRHKTNDELFTLYDSDLVLRIHNARNLEGTRQFLARFKAYLNGFPPSPELAKGFLAQYVARKPHTFYNYVTMIKSFMKWYGEPLDFKVRVPQILPAYTEDTDIEKLFKVIEGKRTHKRTIVQDSLLVTLALKSGLRRAELTNLEPRDIHPDFLVVRNGKGGKDRIVPLVPTLAARLHNFIKGMEPNEKVFKLKPASLTVKIKVFAKKAGLGAFHCHTLRHKFATDLLEAGGDIRAVQELLGHARLDTTQLYLSITDKRVRDTIALLDKRGKLPGGVSAEAVAAGLELDREFGCGRHFLPSIEDGPEYPTAVKVA